MTHDVSDHTGGGAATHLPRRDGALALRKSVRLAKLLENMMRTICMRKFNRSSGATWLYKIKKSGGGGEGER